MNIVEACNSSIVVVATAMPLNADFISQIIDFKDSAHGSIQVVWRDTDSSAGVMVIYGSLLRESTTFDDNDVDQSDFIITPDRTSHIWTYKQLSFRYMQVRWAANGTTTGNADIYAMGKKT